MIKELYYQYQEELNKIKESKERYIQSNDERILEEAKGDRYALINLIKQIDDILKGKVFEIKEGKFILVVTGALLEVEDARLILSMKGSIHILELGVYKEE